MHLGHCAEMAVKIERGFSGNPLKSKLISETAAPHSIRSETKFEDSATQSTSAHHDFNLYAHESLVSRKMRQAKEREEIEREIVKTEKFDQKS